MNKALIKKMKQELDVEFLSDTKTHKNRIEIPSETSDNLYIVSQTIKSGIWMCACLGFRRHRHCKHLKAIVPMIESAVKPKAIESKKKVAKVKPTAQSTFLAQGSMEKEITDDLYQHAIDWIALNDEPTVLTIKPLSEEISVALISDIFYHPVRDVAKDVIAIRKEQILEEKKQRKLEQRPVQKKQRKKGKQGKVVKSSRTAAKKTRKRK